MLAWTLATAYALLRPAWVADRRGRLRRVGEDGCAAGDVGREADVERGKDRHDAALQLLEPRAVPPGHRWPGGAGKAAHVPGA